MKEQTQLPCKSNTNETEVSNLLPKLTEYATEMDRVYVGYTCKNLFFDMRGVEKTIGYQF